MWCSHRFFFLIHPKLWDNSAESLPMVCESLFPAHRGQHHLQSAQGLWNMGCVSRFRLDVGGARVPQGQCQCQPRLECALFTLRDPGPPGKLGKRSHGLELQFNRSRLLLNPFQTYFGEIGTVAQESKTCSTPQAL